MRARAADPETLQFLGALSRAHRAAPASARPRTPGLRRVPRQAQLQARYDAAETTETNSRYWRQADLLDADTANDPGVRATLRSRARYECLEANSFAKGIVHTLANDTVGTGPRLQMRLSGPRGADDPRIRQANDRIERSFNAWAREIQLARKLRTMRIAKCVDGEAFAQIVTNRRLRHAVQLDLRPVEADMITTPTPRLEPNAIDGIRFDEHGNVLEYHRLRYHPGGQFGSGPWDFVPLKPEEVIHLFRQDRPGQHRGIPEVVTALPLFILLRDYTLAVLQHARTIAKHTVILETQAGAVNTDGDAVDPDVEPHDWIDIDTDMMTSIPFGWHANQLRVDQPATTYKMFRDAILNEVARCVSMPFVLAAADSSGANYSSARLDIQLYDMAISVERSEWELGCLDRIFAAWFDEAAMIAGLLPDIGPMDEVPHAWFWDSRGYADPRHAAQAVQLRLKSGVSHRAVEYEAVGKDVDEEDTVAAAGYGMTLEEYRRTLATATFGGGGGGGMQQPPGQPGGDEDADEDPDEQEDEPEDEDEAPRRPQRAAA